MVAWRITFFVDPGIAGPRYDQGFDSKEKFADYVAKNSTTPARLYWQRREKQKELGRKGIEPYATYLKLGEGAEIPESGSLRAARGRGGPQTGSGRETPGNPDGGFDRSGCRRRWASVMLQVLQ